MKKRLILYFILMYFILFLLLDGCIKESSLSEKKTTINKTSIKIELVSPLHSIKNVNQKPYFIKIINGRIAKDSLLSICNFVGYKYSISPELLYAMCERESSLNVKARNGNCKGLMQISERWHKDRMRRLGVTNIYDPYGNILVAADYINELRKVKNNSYYILMRYNMAISTANRLYSRGKVSKYALGIVKREKELKAINGKQVQNVRK